jgi:hypothetical protein
MTANGRHPGRLRWYEPGKNLISEPLSLGFRNIRVAISLRAGALDGSGNVVSGMAEFHGDPANKREKLLSAPEGKCAVLAYHPSGWHSNYFHFMVDVAPRVILAAEASLRMSSEVAVIIDEGMKARFYKEFITMILEKYPLLCPCPISENQSLSFNSIFVVRGLRDNRGLKRRWDRIHPQIPSILRTFFADSYGSSHTDERSVRLLVLRQKGHPRYLENEEQASELLAEYGFRIFRGENLGLKEQFRSFLDSKVVVGVHGAALTNLIFSDSASVLEIFSPSHGFRPDYLQIANLTGSQYFYCRGIERAGSTGVAVPIKVLERFLFELELFAIGGAAEAP